MDEVTAVVPPPALIDARSPVDDTADTSGVAVTETVTLVDFPDFYLAEYARVVRLLTLLTGRLAVAEEVSQDAFVAAHDRWAVVGAYDGEGPAVVTGYLVLPVPGGPGTMCDALADADHPAGTPAAPECVGESAPIEWYPPLTPPPELTTDGGVTSGKVTIAVQRKGGRFFVLPRSAALTDQVPTASASATPPPTT